MCAVWLEFIAFKTDLNYIYLESITYLERFTFTLRYQDQAIRSGCKKLWLCLDLQKEKKTDSPCVETKNMFAFNLEQ